MIKVQCSAVLILDFTSIYFFIYYLGYLYILPTVSSEKSEGFVRTEVHCLRLWKVTSWQTCQLFDASRTGLLEHMSALKTTMKRMSLQNCERGMTEQTVRRRKEIRMRKRKNKTDSCSKNSLVQEFQAGRGDNHLLTLLCLLYVIKFPHSRPNAAGSSVHSAQASPAWERGEARHLAREQGESLPVIVSAFSAEGDPVQGELFGLTGVRGLYMFACCHHRLKSGEQTAD